MLDTDPHKRKQIPIASGVLDYFPQALAEVAKASKAGNDQHNPGKPLHWDKTKSTDHADCIVRHLIERGTIDTDGIRHSAKVAWRALALLEIEIENEARNSEELPACTAGTVADWADVSDLCASPANRNDCQRSSANGRCPTSSIRVFEAAGNCNHTPTGLTEVINKWILTQC